MFSPQSQLSLGFKHLVMSCRLLLLLKITYKELFLLFISLYFSSVVIDLEIEIVILPSLNS